MKICVVGLGYVGLSIAVLLSRLYEVVALDIDQERVAMVNSGKSPLMDPDISSHLSENELNLFATTCQNHAFGSADFIIIAAPTNFEPTTGSFDTVVVGDLVRRALEQNKKATVVIKSTVPIGFVERLRIEIGTDRLLFSPEFLREGSALRDNLYPTRIIVGGNKKKAKKFAELLLNAAVPEDVPVMLLDNTEAEAVKLFSNAFLAMRVSFFNELDSFAMSKSLDASQIIKGVCLDPRIGDYYNNPSFGYGGYCLPKDTRQLLSNFADVPESLMSAIVAANETRKDFIFDAITNEFPQSIGVYRLSMKAGSDNYRDAAILGLIDRLKCTSREITIYEPSVEEEVVWGCRVEKNLESFLSSSEYIIANRWDPQLDSVSEKVFTRDIFYSDQ